MGSRIASTDTRKLDNSKLPEDVASSAAAPVIVPASEIQANQSIDLHLEQLSRTLEAATKSDDFLQVRGGAEAYRVYLRSIKSGAESPK